MWPLFFTGAEKMINTETEILESCQKYGAKKVYDAAYAFMRNDLKALPAVGLKNPKVVGEADYIGSKVFKMLGQVEKSQDLAEIAINLAKLK